MSGIPRGITLIHTYALNVALTDGEKKVMLEQGVLKQGNGGNQAMKITRFRGKLTNREIIVGGVIVGISWVASGGHLLGLVVGIPLAALTVWTLRRVINAHYHIRPSVKRLFTRGK